jgi:hypothetical protein
MKLSLVKYIALGVVLGSITSVAYVESAAIRDVPPQAWTQPGCHHSDLVYVCRPLVGVRA